MGDLRNKDGHTGMSRLVDVNDGFESRCQRVESVFRLVQTVP